MHNPYRSCYYSSSPRRRRSRFVFIVRHPLANALAHKPLLLDPPPLETLVENWVAVLTYMEEDRPHLRHSLRLKLEDLTSDRAGVMAKVCRAWGDNSHSAKGPGGQNQGISEGFSVGYTGY